MTSAGHWGIAVGLVLAFGFASQGCDKSAVPTCEEVVDHKISIFSGEIKRLAESSRKVLIKKCAGMSDRERRCVVDAVTELDLGKCEQDKKRKKPAKEETEGQDAPKKTKQKPSEK